MELIFVNFEEMGARPEHYKIVKKPGQGGMGKDV